MNFYVVEPLVVIFSTFSLKNCLFFFLIHDKFSIDKADMGIVIAKISKYEYRNKPMNERRFEGKKRKFVTKFDYNYDTMATMFTGDMTL